MMVIEGKSASSINEILNLLSDFLNVCTQRNLQGKRFLIGGPNPKNFSVAQQEIYQILIEFDVTKTMGSHEYQLIFYQKTTVTMSAILHINMKNNKRLREISKNWKVAAVTPIFKNGDEKLVKNYTPETLPNIDSKDFDNFIYGVLLDHFVRQLSKQQNGSVRKRPVTQTRCPSSR